MIKNFIYLDEYKMYSLSSQVFEGLTEYLINTNYKEEENKDTQEGPAFSKRVLADAIKDGNKSEEKKYLHDYTFTQFEKYLSENSKLANINNIEDDDIINNCIEFPFIKIKGKVIFNDIQSIQNTLKDFNKIGKALAHMQIFSSGEKNHKNIESYAKANGLNQDQKFLDSLNVLLDFGFNKQLEVQIKHNNHLFSSNIKREYLRTDEDLLIKRYSRETEMEFVILGIVTQCQNLEKKSKNPDEVHNTPKEAMMNFVSFITDMETQFNGKLKNEIIIDPIAIYTEL